MAGFPAGARSLLYGSALGIGGVILLSSLALRAMDVRSPADFKLRVQEAANPLAHSLKASLMPLKARMQVWPSLIIRSKFLSFRGKWSH